MIKKLAFVAVTVAALAAGSTHAGSLMHVYSVGDDVLSNRADTTNRFIGMCYGCISERTGLPRTEYVRPHIKNGRWVGGDYRSPTRNKRGHFNSGRAARGMHSRLMEDMLSNFHNVRFFNKNYIDRREYVRPNFKWRNYVDQHPTTGR